LPVVAFNGTVTTIWFAEALVIDAVTPLNDTVFAEAVLLKLDPVIVIASPSLPEIGTIAVIAGEGVSFSSSLQELRTKVSVLKDSIVINNVFLIIEFKN
jgi:hypothetical protein